MLKTAKKHGNILMIAAATLVCCLSAFVVFSPSGTPERAVFAEEAFSSGENFVYEADSEAAYIGVSFEYRIDSALDTVINLCVIDGEWRNYYGYFEFGVAGATENYDGVTYESVDNGFIRVLIDFKEVTKNSGEAPKTTRLLFSRSDLTNADGAIRNINFLYEPINNDNNVDREKNLGEKYYAGKNYFIYAPRARAYRKVAFEYRVAKIVEEDVFGVCLLDDYNTDYYGYYYFGSDGIKPEYLNDGVTVTALNDGFFRVIMNVPELSRTNQSNNRAHAPKRINAIFLRDVWSKENVFIRNVSFTEGASFSMEKGASVRLEKPYGIKFRAVIPQQLYDEDDLYGMAIFPAEYLEKYSLSGNYVEKLTRAGAEFKNAYLKVKRGDDLDYYVESYLKGLDEEDLSTEYVGVAYKVKDGVYTYAENVAWTKRAVKDVSEKAVKDVDGFKNYSPAGQDLLREVVGCGDLIESGLTVGGFDSNANYKRDDLLPESDRLSLSAAKGESESGEIIISASAFLDGKTYTVTPSDLVHEDGKTILSKDNVSLFNGCYTFVGSNYRHVVYPSNGRQTVLGTGYELVNALVPFGAAVEKGETVFSFENGGRQAVVVDIYVPYAQKAGKYHGEIKIDVLGVGYLALAVEFTVYDFELPAENNARTIFSIPTNVLGAVYGEYSSYDTELYKELYDFLLGFNVNAGRIPEVLGYGETGLNNYINMLEDYSLDPRVSTINLFCGYSLATYTYTYEKPKYVVGGIHIGKETVTETIGDVIVLNEYDRKISVSTNSGEVVYDEYGLRTVLKKIAEYSIENDIDLFKKLVVNCPQIDEPSDKRSYASAMLSYNAVRRSIDYVLSAADIDWAGHEDVKASLDDVPFLVTVGPDANVIDGNRILDDVKDGSAYIPADKNNKRLDLTIDYKALKDFVALVAAFDGTDKPAESVILNDYLAYRPEHTHIWWYTCCLSVNPYYNLGLNSDRVKMRANRWAQFGMGVDGELYCSVNNWLSVSDDEEVTVLTEDEVWAGMANQAGLIEDCVLVYPNVLRYYDADFRFVATYRLYAVRESVDDYNYLCYAKRLIDRISDGERKLKAQATLDGIVSSVYTGVIGVTDDADALRKARAAVAELIVELR